MQRLGPHTLKRTTLREIKHLCEKIAIEFRPEKIILFGSHAYGKPQWDSDVDLLIIMPFKGRRTRKAIEILDRLNPATALDLLVRTPRQVEKRLAMGDFFMREIIERGKVMYESPHQ
ncbi:MAG: nucleotidyltransferase domain-containing protein [Acidobacteriota bacterium]